MLNPTKTPPSGRGAAAVVSLSMSKSDHQPHTHTDHHHHDDHHGYGHDHSHVPANFDLAFGVGAVLNLGFVAIEATYGVLANSLALLVDAGFNLSSLAISECADGTEDL